jgi:hypothetical protein
MDYKAAVKKGYDTIADETYGGKHQFILAHKGQK